MGSFRGNCEIVEAKDELNLTRRKPPVLKKGPNKSLENDINKLFEAVNLGQSKSLDFSGSRRNASKKPMGADNSHSSGIRFSEPVSLKQALRGLCISQAAEMAAVKRLSLPPASPRVSESGKILNLYRSVGIETSASGEEYRIEISLVPEEKIELRKATNSSTQSSSFGVKPIVSSESEISRVKGETATFPTNAVVPPQHLQNPKSKSPKQSARSPPPQHLRDPKTKSPNQSARSSPRIPVIKDAKSSIVHQNVSPPILKADLKPISEPDKKLSRLNKDKTAPNPRKNTRVQAVPSSSSAVKVNRDVIKSTRTTSRPVKHVIRNKNLVIKKSKKVASIPEGISKSPSESEKSICHKCQCSLKDTNEVVNKLPDPIVNTKIPSKFSDISQSSKSSIYDFSSSANTTTTSISEESNFSGSSSGSRPHMSKDTRWESINRIKKQYGFIGLSHFNLLKKLGSGDIGTVYLAELVGTNCPFAIKVMDNEFLARRKKMPRAQTEREILRMLDHPFLPTLYAQFTSDNLSCLVMEFCPGGDLHVLRQKQPGRYFPEQAARFYVAEVLLALEYLHMLGIVYRDLKPENILVREDGHIMLTDFDLSLRCSTSPTLVKSPSIKIDPHRASGPCTGPNCIDPFCTGPSCQISCFSPRILVNSRAKKLQASVKAQAQAQARARSLPQLVAEPTEARSNSFVGTHEYLAPEIIKGEGHGSAVDWWTFGVFLYELLYGKAPFKGNGNDETLTNVVLQSLKFPDSPMVSFQARDLIRGLLVKEPENRLGSKTGAAEIKRHPFFEGLNWALIRCALPPQIPEFYGGDSEKGKKFLDYGGGGEKVEFELF